MGLKHLWYEKVESGQVIENLQSICVNAAYVCAAGVGAVAVAYGAARGMKFLSGGVKCVTAVSLAGSLIFGGMTVTSVHVAGAKTNDTNQIENGKWRMREGAPQFYVLHFQFYIRHRPSPTTTSPAAGASSRFRLIPLTHRSLQSNNQTIEQSPVVWEAGWFRERFDLFAERLKRGSMKYNTAEGDMSGLLLTRTRN